AESFFDSARESPCVERPRAIRPAAVRAIGKRERMANPPERMTVGRSEYGGPAQAQHTPPGGAVNAPPRGPAGLAESPCGRRGGAPYSHFWGSGRPRRARRHRMLRTLAAGLLALTLLAGPAPAQDKPAAKGKPDAIP